MITLTTLADISRLQHNLITGNLAIWQSGNRAIGQSGRVMPTLLTANLLLSSYLFDWNCIKDALLNLGRDGCPQPSANSTSKPFSCPTNGCVGTRIPTLFRIANEVLTALQLEKHPGKTFIGKLSQGIDTLGYQFNEQGIAGPSKTTIQRSIKQTTRFSLMTIVGICEKACSYIFEAQLLWSAALQRRFRTLWKTMQETFNVISKK